MNSDQRRILLFFKIGFFVHFALLFAYCFPDAYVPGFIDGLSKKYAYPLFQARWNLFAPDPPKHHKELRYKYFADGEWSDWQDPVSDVQNSHHQTRVGAATKMYHVIQNGSHYLWDDYYKFPGDSIKNSFGYLTMNYFVSQLHRGLEIDSVRLKLTLSGYKQFDDVEVLPKELNFPSSSLAHE